MADILTQQYYEAIPETWANNEYKFGHFLDENYRRTSSKIWTDCMKNEYNIDDDFWKKKTIYKNIFYTKIIYSFKLRKLYKKIKRNKIGNNAFLFSSEILQTHTFKWL